MIRFGFDFRLYSEYMLVVHNWRQTYNQGMCYLVENKS